MSPRAGGRREKLPQSLPEGEVRQSRPRGNSRRRRAGDDPLHITDSLGEVTQALGMGKGQTVPCVFRSWNQVVGDAMAAHAQPLRLEGDLLIVSVDHPAWAVQVRYLGTEILAKLAMACGTGSPSELRVTVRR